MLIRWSCSLALLVLASAALPAHAAAEPKAAARDADIVVTAAPTDELSDWKRAETDHIIVFSDGSERELVRVTTRLEQLNALMSRLYPASGPVDGRPKLEVMLFDSRADLQRLGLRNLRSAEGPFTREFLDQRFYDPRIDGDVLAIVRNDQIIDLDTKMARDRYCDDLAEAGADCVGQMAPSLPPVARSWEAVLYSAFAQRFILTNAPAAYPRWYLDGIGALFSTIDVRKDGSIEYARPPVDYEDIFRSYGDVSAREVLTGSYLDAPSLRMKWTPYHAWLITHYFVFSNPKPKRQAQFANYMAALGRGASLAEAATAFDDLGRLNREIAGYASRAKAFARTPKPIGPVPAPSVTMLTHAQFALQEARFGLGDPGPALADRSTPSIDALRDAADADAMLVAAEALCRREPPAECLTAIERVLAQSPQNARALAWKGIALTGQALTGLPGDRADALQTARATLERAMQSDPRDPVAAIAYFQSFTKAGEPVPESAMIGVAKVAAAVPAAPWPRLLLGEELVRQGKSDLARRLLAPVLYGAYDSPEKNAARALFSSAETAAPSSL